MNEQDFLDRFFQEPDRYWGEFSAQYAAIVERQVLSVCPHHPAGEDILQDVYFELLRGDLARLRQWQAEKGTFTTYLRVVVARIVIDLLRSRRYRRFFTPKPMAVDDQTTPCQRLPAVTPNPRERAEDEEVVRRLEQALEKLLATKRAQPVDAVILRSKYLGVGAKEIGRLTGLTEDAINLRFHRLKEQLRQATALKVLEEI